ALLHTTSGTMLVSIRTLAQK
ncbi:hypothetical protein KIPB_012259, partial [Kipferlia bialata]